jgi:hypothetical protein
MVSKDLFMAVHAFVEIAVAISFLAAVVFMMRLWPGRDGKSGTAAFITNTTYVALCIMAVVYGLVFRL